MALVAIRSNLYAWEAELFASRLRAAGVECFVAGAHARISWAHMLALGGATILVAAEDRELAMELLAAPAEPAGPGDVCPNCASDRVELRRPGALWFLASTALTAPFPTRSGRRRCAACGHAWRATAARRRWEPESEELRAAELEIGVGTRVASGSPWLALCVLVVAISILIAAVVTITSSAPLDARP